MADGSEGQRFIVPSCCEDFILHEDQGLLARVGEEFECFACRRCWQKTAATSFRCITDGVEYDIVVERGELGARLVYLSPRQEPQPVTRRCCQNMIRYSDPKIGAFLQSSPRWSLEGVVLTCLVCGTKWQPRLVEVLGWQKLCYQHTGLAAPLVLQELPSGRVLVPLAEWSP